MNPRRSISRLIAHRPAETFREGSPRVAAVDDARETSLGRGARERTSACEQALARSVARPNSGERQGSHLQPGAAVRTAQVNRRRRPRAIDQEREGARRVFDVDRSPDFIVEERNPLTPGSARHHPFDEVRPREGARTRAEGEGEAGDTGPLAEDSDDTPLARELGAAVDRDRQRLVTLSVRRPLAVENQIGGDVNEPPAALRDRGGQAQGNLRVHLPRPLGLLLAPIRVGEGREVDHGVRRGRAPGDRECEPPRDLPGGGAWNREAADVRRLSPGAGPEASARDDRLRNRALPSEGYSKRLRRERASCRLRERSVTL